MLTYYSILHLNQPLVNYYQTDDNLTDNLPLVIQSFKYILQKSFSDIQRKLLSYHDIISGLQILFFIAK